MKSSIPNLLLLVAALFAGPAVAIGAISVGDTHQQVMNVLGKPSGYIGSDSFQVYYFDRGEVVFRNGRVESHSIVSQEEAERKQRERELDQAARAAERAALAELQAENREKRIAEGTSIRNERRSNPQFNALPASARLAFWQTFMQKFPDVDVEFDYAVALQEARVEHSAKVAAQQQEQRMQELERRVRDAEGQARLAEREARYRADYYYYPVRHYPIIIRPPHQTPPAPCPSETPRGNTVVIRKDVRQVIQDVESRSPDMYARSPKLFESSRDGLMQ
jgi:hypothetical protein